MTGPVKLQKAIARHAALLKDIVSRFPPAERDAITVAMASAAVGAAVRNAARPAEAYRVIGETAAKALAMAMEDAPAAPESKEEAHG